MIIEAANGKTYNTDELDNGTVEHEGKTIYLIQQAYADGIGEDIHYDASGVDIDGNVYHVRWETTEAWDNAVAEYAAERRDYDEAHAQGRSTEYPECPTLLDDESNACDWDNPSSVTLHEAV